MELSIQELKIVFSCIELTVAYINETSMRRASPQRRDYNAGFVGIKRGSH
jgi:hypothetical protein